MPTPLSFNAAWYLQQNPDVAAAIEAGASFSAFEHFSLYGRSEGRSASPLFDAQHYLANNPDVAQAVAQGLITAWDHFELFGGEEGRSPTPLFDPGFYLQQNPDVAAAIANGQIASAVQHFLLFGLSEFRAINPAIDLGRYLNANPDLAEAVANGQVNPLDHLLQYGVAEGRNLGNGVSLADFSNDPGFTQALGNGNAVQALARVGAVAPFLPTFERPAAWTPPENTPIPLDFVPPANAPITLVVPPEVVVPPAVTLPPVFQPVTPQPPTPTPPSGPVLPSAPVDDGGFVLPPVAFSVALSGAGVVMFGGSATGDIMITGENPAPDTYLPTELAFTRGGHTASARIAISAIADKGIPALGSGEMLIVSNTLFTPLREKLAGDVSLRVTDSRMDLTDASVSLLVLKAMEEATTGFVDASAVRTTYGTIEEAVHVLVTKNGTSGDAISVASNIRVGLPDATADATDLRAIEEATTGTAFALNLTEISGNTADVLHVLVTKRGETGDVIYVQPNLWAAVTLTDAGSLNDTDAILNATYAPVTTKLIPGGTYNNFAPGDKIDTGLTFQHHVSQDKLGADGHLNWRWVSNSKELVIEVVDNTSGDGPGYQTQTLQLVGTITGVTELNGVFTLSGTA